MVVAGQKVSTGKIQILRGEEAGVYDYGEQGIAAGLPTISIEGSGTKLYYSGSVKNITRNTFSGEYFSLSYGADVGVSIGGSWSYSPLKTGEFVLGQGASIGYGVSPVFGLDFNLEWGTSVVR